MSMKELELVRLLAEKIGIKTLGDLEEFKRKTKANTNEMLIKRLALYVAMDMTIEEVVAYKSICD